ncbi:sensor histidine kinase [Roseiterribacter gracilis]|uniref:histidine kinase n=1 Tax=Roseiterribacter gracilis TaxID=2812848 RepID=A0A8S8XG69_9PROT|nr:two-component sensor histidine kinase [Rhodospirillales bacterium TMPK1]
MVPRRALVRGVAFRIALVVGLAIFLAQTAAGIIVAWNRPDPPPIFTTQQLINEAERARLALEAAPIAERHTRAASLGTDELHVEWLDHEPRAAAWNRGAFDMLARQISEGMGLPREAVQVRTLRKSEVADPGPSLFERPLPAPTPLRRPAGTERREFTLRRDEFAVPGVFALTVRLDDGSWVSLSPSTEPAWTRWLRSTLLWLACAAVISIAAALIVARRVTRPIEVFAAAAQRLGRDPGAYLMDEHGPSEIRTAIGAFNEMQGRIRRFVQDRTQMLAAIGHDLRTVMTRLRFRLALLGDGEQQRRMAADLEEMDKMLLAVLSFVKDEAAREPRQALDLAAMATTVTDDLADMDIDATYEGPDHAIFTGQPLGLKRLLTNLVDNAVKYGERARVLLSDQGAQIVVTVEDDGPGIPVDQRERVFAAFTRLESSRSRETGGMGLGLAVSRSIARAHGGDVHIADSARGARFVVTLPR